MTALAQALELLSANADEPVIVMRGIEYSEMLDAKYERDRLRELYAHYAKQIELMDQQLRAIAKEYTCER